MPNDFRSICQSTDTKESQRKQENQEIQQSENVSIEYKTNKEEEDCRIENKNEENDSFYSRKQECRIEKNKEIDQKSLRTFLQNTRKEN